MKRRQVEVSRPLTDLHTTTPLNELHRPRFLLSGLLTCGVCGGGYTITVKDRYGCARRARQGTCANGRGIKRQELVRCVLDGLRASLVTPDLVAEFVAEYQAEWNRLQGERRVAAGQRDRRLADVKQRLAGIVDAIERGIITPTTKARLETLEPERGQLESAPVEAPLPAIHPNLTQLYRDKVARLEVELADPEIAAEAKSVLRSLIKTIKITPGPRRGKVELELQGELASILAMAQGKRNKDGTPVSRIQVSVVAGVGFEPTTFRYEPDKLPAPAQCHHPGGGRGLWCRAIQGSPEGHDGAIEVGNGALNSWSVFDPAARFRVRAPSRSRGPRSRPIARQALAARPSPGWPQAAGLGTSV